MKTEPEVRYVLHPGVVSSRSDKQLHHISGPALVKLYGVVPEQCVYADRAGYRPKDGDVHLVPRYSGKYDLALCEVTNLKEDQK